MASSQSRKMIAIIGGIVAVVIGGLLYFLLVFQPAREREAARDQIRAWEPRWEAARDCLLGDKPLAADAADAMTARELVAGTTDAAMGDCTKLVGGMTRPPGPSSGVAAVENTWPLLEVAIGEVAQAYGEHRARPLGHNPLPEALAQLREAHTALRAAAGMGPPPLIEAPPTPLLTTTPVMLRGAGPIAELAGVTTDGVLRGRAIVLGPNGEPKPFDIVWKEPELTGEPAPEGVASLPDRSWTLHAEPSADGAALRAGTVQVVRADTDLAPLFALGAGPGRFALYASPGGILLLARSGDSGATWTNGAAVEEGLRGEVAWGASPAGDRLFLAWTGAEQVMVRALSPEAHATGPLPAPTPLAAQVLQTWCTAGALWIVGGTPTGYQVWRNGEGAGAKLDVSQPLPAACDGERLVVRTAGPDGTAVEHACSATACTELPFAGARDRIVGLAGGHVYRVDTRLRMLGVWRDAEPPAFYRLPEPRRIYAVVDVGGKPVILLVGSDPTALEAARLP